MRSRLSMKTARLLRLATNLKDAQVQHWSVAASSTITFLGRAECLSRYSLLTMRKNSATLCVTAACQQLATVMLGYMAPEGIDPCTDFPNCRQLLLLSSQI